MHVSLAGRLLNLPLSEQILPEWQTKTSFASNPIANLMPLTASRRVHHHVTPSIPQMLRGSLISAPFQYPLNNKANQANVILYFLFLKKQPLDLAQCTKLQIHRSCAQGFSPVACSQVLLSLETDKKVWDWCMSGSLKRGGGTKNILARGR